MAKKYYCVEVCYNGKNFFGWQKQRELPTIQGIMEDSLSEFYPYGNIGLKAASRTDAGVHAISQFVKLPFSSRIKAPSQVLEILREKIHAPVYIKSLTRVNPTFRVSQHVERKQYIYILGLGLGASLDNSQIYPHVGTAIKDFIFESHHIKKMNDACRCFLGTHSFHNFQYHSDTTGSMVRKIEYFEVSKITPDHLMILICGNGFLRHMVRILVGVLINYAKGEFLLNDIQRALTSDEKIRLGFIAPAAGLILYKIQYMKYNERPVIASTPFDDILMELKKISDLAK